MFDVLIIAWILTWFGFDDILIEGINQLLNQNYTTSVYWVIAFVIGAIELFLK